MANNTVLVPEAVMDWIDGLVRAGEYSDAGGYLADIVLRDRERRGEALSIEELRQIVAISRSSKMTSSSVDEVFQEARRIAEARKAARS